MTVKEALNMGYTMEQLIEKGYEPLEMDGEKYSKDKKVEKEAENAKFTIKMDGEAKFTNSKMQFYVDGIKVYYTYGNYSEIIKVVDEDGTEYTVSQAIDKKICTINVLLKKLELENGVKSGIMGK